MKNFLPTIIILFHLSFIGNSQNNGKLDSIKAANPQQIRTIVKSNPTSLVIGVMPLITSEYRLLLEFPSGPMQSSQLGFSYLGKSPFIRFIENDTLKKNPNAYFLRTHISGYRLQGSFKFFVNDWIHALGFSSKPIYSPRGFYISPQVSFATAKITYKFANQYDIFFRVNHFNVNMLAGCQFTFGKIAVDMFTGIGYKQNQWFEHNQNVVRQITPPEEILEAIPWYFSPLKFSIGINFGYCF